MSESAGKPTRRVERRVQTVREIKDRAMKQISDGGPDAVSLNGIVREMSMSPAAIYRYFANRDALLADLVVDAYNELADYLGAIGRDAGTPDDHLAAVLTGSRTWALAHANAYRLIFQTSAGSGQDFAAETTVPAASRSMTVIVDALARVAVRPASEGAPAPSASPEVGSADIRKWGDRSGFGGVSVGVLTLALVSWTRVHGVISLELGGHLAATGIDPAMLFDAEVRAIRDQAARLPPGVALGSVPSASPAAG